MKTEISFLIRYFLYALVLIPCAFLFETNFFIVICFFFLVFEIDYGFDVICYRANGKVMG